MRQYYPVNRVDPLKVWHIWGVEMGKHVSM